MSREKDLESLAADLHSMCQRLAAQLKSALYGRIDQPTCLRLLEEYQADFGQDDGSDD
jgi:hypothetical protein